jgi:hypothetical protein
VADQPIRNGTKYLTAAFVVAGWLLGAGMQWGISKTAQGDLERRMSEHDQQLRDLQQQLRDEAVPRKEYESWQREIRDRLQGIENTLDRNYRSGGKQ